jgi:hypothetical protein
MSMASSMTSAPQVIIRVNAFNSTRGAVGTAAGGPLTRLLDFDPDTLQNALGNLAQIIAAVLGIAITVVSIVVQIAATRYTSRVAEMFFRDRTNLAVMGFFVVACIDAVWVSLSVARDYVPRLTIVVTVGMVTASLLALIPYFAYVFDFLDPEKVIARIGRQTLRNALGGGRPTDASVETRQGQTVTSMEQLAGVAVNAISQKDKVIASNAISALRRVIVDYLPAKSGLEPSWFTIGPGLRADPDLVALAPESVTDLAAAGTWLEWKGLRQMRSVFGEALKEMPEMAHVVVIETRYVAEAALAASERAVLSLTVRFMNTYLRAALNARDVRTAYNVLNQYRQLAENMMCARGGSANKEVSEVGAHLRYYAQLANGMGLSFVAETAAYDLGALCEMASITQSPVQDDLLATFLDIDKEAENSSQEKGLRGVRKAQAKLAAYYLLSGAVSRARQIYDDMALETIERLRSIRDEMLSVRAKEFWEIIDRGTNFDYVDEDRKDKLREFFGWFADLDAGGIARTSANTVRSSGSRGGA